MTAPTWRATAYPVTTTCPFCGNTLTINLDGDGPTTSTTGHAHDCVQNPNRQRAAKGPPKGRQRQRSVTAPQHDYSGAVERLVLVHQGQPLPALTRLRLAARTSDLACAWRRARALDRLATLNDSKKGQL